MLKTILKTGVILLGFILIYFGVSFLQRDNKNLVDENLNQTNKIQENKNVVQNNISTSTTKIANPASINCVEKGGKLEIKKDERGEYGVCSFDDGRQCEEWALFRKECPVGGVKLTGYDTDVEKFCAITGGIVDINAKTCEKNGSTCDLDLYYQGNCEE